MVPAGGRPSVSTSWWMCSDGETRNPRGTPDSYYGIYYRRLAARRGKQRALVAVMHKLTVAIWHILHNKVKHKDLGADYFAKRDPQQAMRRIVREANSLGMTVRFDPIPTAA